MASFLDKLKVNTAITENTKLDLSCDHISSADFMQFNVVYTKEMVPGEKLSVNMETFTRMEPLVVPTFGRANIKNRAFFVPFRTIFDGWNDFITDTPHAVSNSATTVLQSQVPIIDQSTFWSWMIFGAADSGYVEVLDEQNPEYQLDQYDVIDQWAEDFPNDYDYIITGEDASTIIDTLATQYQQWGLLEGFPIKLTNKGRQIMKIMNSLGYIFNTRLDQDNESYSALPLLALAKVYMDWFYPSAYNTAVLDYLFIRNTQSTGISLSVSDLESIFNIICRVSYDSDYFVSAWDKPDSPIASLSSNYTLVDIERISQNQGQVTYVGNSQTVLAPSLSTTGNFITQYGLTALKSLTDYMKRHQLVGARALDRYLARFGVQLSAEKLKRSIYLGTNATPLQIGDVMSQSDTNGASLGSYAGKGIGYGNGSFDYDTQEYGMFIIVSTIVPSVGYYQGVDRNVMHKTRLDFWTPEFDNLGTQAISKAELWLPENGSKLSGTTDYDNEIFGYIPRYAEYKCSRDRLTGDKRYNSMAVGQDSWHLMRKLDFENALAAVHSLDFVRGYTYEADTNSEFGDIYQFNRIFQNVESSADHFNMIYHFNVASYSPMKALYDTYEFEDKGKKVTEDVNGVKMN